MQQLKHFAQAVTALAKVKKYHQQCYTLFAATPFKFAAIFKARFLRPGYIAPVKT